MTSLANLPLFLGYFAVTLGLLALGVAAYAAVTPHSELAMIRAGNPAAAVALAGTLLGFALPIAASVVHSRSLADAAVWAVIALLAQLAAFTLCTRLLIPGWRAAMERGEAAGATLKAAVALAVGLLNAACLTP